MASIFTRVLIPEEPVSPYSLKRIEQEIAHLRQGISVRKETERLLAARLLSAVALCSLLWLFFMDPFVYAFQKGDAMRAYAYLHQFGSDAKAKTLVESGILSPQEARLLNERGNSARENFDSPQQAEKSVDSVVTYMSNVNELRSGHYEQLDPIGKLRYLLFVRMGLMPPVEWSALSPTVTPDGN